MSVGSESDEPVIAGEETVESPEVVLEFEVERGEALIERGSVDLVLLDLNLPDVSGETIAAEVAGSVPILMLTAKSSEADRIRGLELGPTTTSRIRSHRDHGRVQRVGSWSRDASGGSGRSE